MQTEESRRRLIRAQTQLKYGLVNADLTRRYSVMSLLYHAKLHHLHHQDLCLLIQANTYTEK